MMAAREVLDRCLGKPKQTIEGEWQQGYVPELTDEQRRRAQRIAELADAVDDDLDSRAPTAVDSNGQGVAATTPRTTHTTSEPAGGAPTPLG